MKKVISIVLIFALVLSLSSCDYQNISNKKVNVVTTIFPFYDFAKNICGSEANITMLLKPGTESHTYDPTPRDIFLIKNSDVFIYTGGESDSWADKILDSVNTKKTKVIRMIDEVDAVYEESLEGMEKSVGEEDDEEYDEHIWTSPKNAILITKAITKELCLADTEKENIYIKNSVNYIKKLNNLDIKIREIVNGSKTKTLVFGDRFPFKYFADEYGLLCYAAFPGCSDKTEAGIKTLNFLINKVKDEKIPVVFYIEFSNQKTADVICEETGAKKLLFHSCHNVTKDEFESGISYIEIMENNLNNLEEALK